MTLALALLSLMIVMLFNALVLGAMRQAFPRETSDPVWAHPERTRR